MFSTLMSIRTGDVRMAGIIKVFIKDRHFLSEEKGGHLFEGQVLSSNDHTEPTLPALVLQKDAAS